MKTFISACFAALLLCGGTGCGQLCCRPWFPFLNHACTQGCQGVGIFNWSHCCDTCDQCGHWNGEDIIAETGDAYRPRYAGTPNRPLKHHKANRARTSGYHVVSRVEHPAAEEAELVETTEDEGDVEQIVDETEEPTEVVAEPTPARRVRSSRSR